MYELLYASIVVLIASALQSITGSGFAIIAAPFLLIVYNSQDGIQVSMLLSFAIAAVLTPKIKQHIDYALLKKLIAGSIFGVPIGVLFFAIVELKTMKFTIAIVVLFITMYSLFQYYKVYFAQRPRQLEVQNNSGDEVIPETSPAKKKTPGRKELLVGFFAGTLTTSVNMPGVPTALYFNSDKFTNEVVRSTTLGFFIAVYITGIVMQLLTVGISQQVFALTLKLAPACILGIFIGNLLFKKVNRPLFQLITNFILLYMSIYTLINTL